MKKIVRSKAAKITAILAATCGLTLGLSGSAQATTQSGAIATAKSACGSSYTHVSFVTSMGIINQDLYWAVVLYSSTTGKNCAVNIKDSANWNYGVPSWLGMGIKTVSQSSYTEDINNYTKYAGPVYVYAPNECVNIHLTSPDLEWWSTAYQIGCG